VLLTGNRITRRLVKMTQIIPMAEFDCYLDALV